MARICDTQPTYVVHLTEIEGQGGRNLRVVLDYEMKKRLCRDLAKLGPGRASSKNKHLFAERHGLRVVRGKIPVPDIRIEYEARAGERAPVASNSPPVTTEGEIWRKKSAPDSPSTPTGGCFEAPAGAGSV
ncbi:MAG TPA: hypothetical protein VK937_08535 [Candidatus Limnocylindria bacterium]|nr:hypothetical protein [Candidatus Limnocylindria bacterium]